MSTKIKGTEEAWETGKLGQDEKFVKKSELTLDEMQALDNALELKAISIRMPNSLIDSLKDIAEINGLGYQTLIKQVLNRFVDAEMKQALREKAEHSRKRA